MRNSTVELLCSCICQNLHADICVIYKFLQLQYNMHLNICHIPYAGTVRLEVDRLRQVLRDF